MNAHTAPIDAPDGHDRPFLGGNALMRPADVQKATGMGRSTLYAHIDRGTFTPPVKLGERFAVWPQDEVERIINARIAGYDDEAVRQLCTELTEARKSRI